MDSNNKKLKQQKDAELSLDMLKHEQNERIWLEEDFERICHEEHESLELMRVVWQGDQARNFGYYLEDLQADEKNKWRQTFQAEEEKRQEKINTYQKKINTYQKNIYQLESKQQDIQKELFQ
ncbi:DNA double-strand break repair Rad50 ATPase [Listeria monocytogenes]|nr:DNA double-strand break repair Rad50 ATPase [Listeria monocytogenes]EGN2095813.1 DNA double-strand break repair Rad50 ATPase [Listeria monocytogenes]